MIVGQQSISNLRYGHQSMVLIGVKSQKTLRLFFVAIQISLLLKINFGVSGAAVVIMAIQQLTVLIGLKNLLVKLFQTAQTIE
jgi:hypothetical protein